MKRNRITAKFGGAFKRGGVPGYESIGYVWITLPDGTRMQLFYNHETRLFVADIVAAGEQFGIEFVRCTVPQVSK